MAVRPKVVAFDVIGTVFSLEPLRDELVGLGLPTSALELWFAETLRDAFALASTGSFAPFRSLFDASLDNVAARLNARIEATAKQNLLDRLGALPAHPDAMQAFRLLSNGGIRILALSNGAAAASKKLLDGAGLAGFVERTISVDEIKSFKPRREIYLHAAELARVAPAELALVATHGWDVHGAKAAGLIAAFVARGQIYPSAMIAPDVVGESLLEVARHLVH